MPSMSETYTIAVKPSQRRGKLTATSSDGHTFTTPMPLLDGARHWQAQDAPSTATITTERQHRMGAPQHHRPRR
jgi:hypothetical protein